VRQVREDRHAHFLCGVEALCACTAGHRFGDVLGVCVAGLFALVSELTRCNGGAEAQSIVGRVHNHGSCFSCLPVAGLCWLSTICWLCLSCRLLDTHHW